MKRWQKWFLGGLMVLVVAAVVVMVLPAAAACLNIPFWLWLILCIVEGYGGNPFDVI